MNGHPPILRRGMTVIELMVVVMILGLLAVVVLPSISTTIDSRRFREAARTVSSFVARSQVRALDARQPRGLMIQPLASNPFAAIELFFASTPAAYCGESTRSTVTIEPVPAGTPDNPAPPVEQLGLSFDLLTADRIRDQLGFVQPGDAIQFNAGGPEYCFLPNEPSGANAAYEHGVTMWAADSQTPGNTPWPRGEKIPFRILRQPHRASTGVLQLQRGAAIDIAWSCIGSRPLYDPDAEPDYRIIQNLSQPVTLLFDRSGKPQQLVHSGGIRTMLGEPLFLLIGSAELAGNSPVEGVTGEIPDAGASGSLGANWQYADAVWLVVDSNSGIVKVGPVAAQATSVAASQQYVRMTIAQGVAER